MWRGCALPMAAAMVVAGQPASATINRTMPPSSTSPEATAARLLHAHNAERLRLGVRPLLWDPRLAESAASYGRVLARRGVFAHSPEHARHGQLENLWMGTGGVFSPEQMVGHWLSERRSYRPGMFPAVSRTGRWKDVAHYTQIIWPTTTHVGCAIQRSAGWDYLICRYSPPGNVIGRRTH